MDEETGLLVTMKAARIKIFLSSPPSMGRLKWRLKAEVKTPAAHFK